VKVQSKTNHKHKQMEDVSKRISATEEKIRQAEADGDKDYVKTLTSYLVELQREKNALLTAPSGNLTTHFHSFIFITI
jgi:uncharacterized membrane protein (DUF106 family)